MSTVHGKVHAEELSVCIANGEEEYDQSDKWMLSDHSKTVDAKEDFYVLSEPNKEIISSTLKSEKNFVYCYDEIKTVVSDLDKKKFTLDDIYITCRKKVKNSKKSESKERKRRVTIPSIQSLTNVFSNFSVPLRSKAISSENILTLADQNSQKLNESVTFSQISFDQLKNVCDKDFSPNKPKRKRSMCVIGLTCERPARRSHRSESDTDFRVNSLPQWFKYFNPTSNRKKSLVKSDAIEEICEITKVCSTAYVKQKEFIKS